ncbi:hypothetical protein HD554DRAFT_2022042 [Boletus coccyginus]|nr:hypothetical protein HD554DRAFT_2022042 [Boletus coccyginus]
MTSLPFTATTTADPDWILNPTQCHLKTTKGKGRGVFATQAIPPRTVIEISPVLLFSKREYDDHGKHTLFAHYTFNWRDGRMALALGLGSLFNHAEDPNVSFSVDSARECIVYTSARTIQPDEELCIFYGHQLWFDPIDGAPSRTSNVHENTDPWGGLADIQGYTEDDVTSASSDNDVVAEDDLPFTWKKLGLEKEEEKLGDIELFQAWVVDIPDQTHTATMLRWLKQSGLDKDALSHLKRVRRQASLCTLLLDTSPDPPALPREPSLDPPYQLPVPRHPALTPTSLALKNTFWPTVFAPKRKWEPEPWTMARVRWASDAVRRLKRAYARIAQSNGELPVVAHVPILHREDGERSRPFFGYDARTSTQHPLRHAALDVIRQVAAYRAERPASEGEAVHNGAQYLLTGLSLFITHEPCLMCTMALLHSRVKEVFYLVPMPKTGGCGGIACVPSLKGVNHRFIIAVWKEDPGDWPDLLDTEIDV